MQFSTDINTLKEAPVILVSLHKVENQYFCHIRGGSTLVAAFALSCDVTCALIDH
jgi:hypothetical protein